MILIFSENYHRQFKSLNRSKQDLISAALDLFVDDPFDLVLRNHELRDRPGYRSISADHDLRIIFRQKDDYAEVLLLRVGPHSIYKT
jgi:mRNA-degrading endonuclease YafQ of YafQ-DinJ toxin-antitoxin module